MKTTWIACACVCGSMLLLGGCPPAPTGQDPPAVTAQLSISTSRGVAPLIVTVSATGSSSTNGGPLQFLWDFAGEATSTDVTATHTFTTPGRHVITLTVTDPKGEQAIATTDVRIPGGAVVAVIVANTTSGPAPLTVSFDGTQSTAENDTILDYYWDFKDGSEVSRKPTPRHVFAAAGEYVVTLRVTSAGGVDVQTQTTISVGTRNGSLQFNGAQFATLPLGSDQALAAFSFEAWVKADSEGGTVATLGDGAFTLQVLPGSNTIRATINGQSSDASATDLAGNWRHIAVTYDSTRGGAIYLNGAALGSAVGTGAVGANRVTLGVGYRGKVAEVRLWAVSQSSADISANMGTRVSGQSANLLGAWSIDEGSGQQLANRTGAAAGTLGGSASAESADPAWSSDGPPL